MAKHIIHHKITTVWVPENQETPEQQARAEVTSRAIAERLSLMVYAQESFNGGYKLRPILSRKSVRTLREIASMYWIRGGFAMRKDELVEKLYETLTDPAQLEKRLLTVTGTQWALLRRVSKTKAVIVDTDDDIDSYEDLANIGVISFTQIDGRYYCVMPAEIQRTFFKMEEDGFAGRLERAVLLNNFAVAATHLYGALTLEDFVAVYNHYNVLKTDMEYVTATLPLFTVAGYGYSIWKDYLCNRDYLEEDNYLEAPYFVETASLVKRYLPPRPTFLEYSDWSYIEQTRQVKALHMHVRRLLPDDIDEQDDLMDEIVAYCRYDDDDECFYAMFENRDVYFESNEQMDKVFACVYDVLESARLWLYNGHTRAEVRKMAGHLQILP